MLRAVPITVRTADSRLLVLRSTSLIFAISRTCFFVTLPTLLRFGSAEPFAMLAARFSSTEAGGVFRMKVKVRSVYTVTSTGKIIPSGSLAVLALNCLQKSMMFKPCGPSAVPTGGAGVALPAGNCKDGGRTDMAKKIQTTIKLQLTGGAGVALPAGNCSLMVV